MLKEFLSQKGIAFDEHDVTTDTLAAQEVISKTGQNSVPVTVIDGQTVVGFDQSRLEQLIAQIQKEKIVFGAAIADAVAVLKNKSPVIVGAYVGKVKPDSLADKLGLKPGDIIIQMNMERIAGVKDFEQTMSNLKSGTKISLVYVRDNTILTNETMLQ